MHTPTPWKIGKHGSIVTDDPDRQVEITGEHAKYTIEFYGGHVICETVTPDNAAFIVEACNRAEAAERTAAELRARIDNLEQEIAELRGELKMSYTSDDPRITVNEWQAERDALRFESERNTAIDCAEDYKSIIAQMKAEHKAQIEQLRAELATVKDERDALKRAMRDYMNDIFAHTAPPTDWDQETPYGQMLDGLGDEVEP